MATVSGFHCPELALTNFHWILLLITEFISVILIHYNPFLTIVNREFFQKKAAAPKRPMACRHQNSPANTGASRTVWMPDHTFNQEYRPFHPLSCAPCAGRRLPAHHFFYDYLREYLHDSTRMADPYPIF